MILSDRKRCQVDQKTIPGGLLGRSIDDARRILGFVVGYPKQISHASLANEWDTTLFHRQDRKTLNP